MICAECGCSNTWRGCEPVERGALWFCSGQCVADYDDRRRPAPALFYDAGPRSLQATASRARLNRRWSRSMFGEEPELAEDA